MSQWGEMDAVYRRMVIGMKARRRAARKARQNGYLRSIAVEIGEVAPGVEYWIVPNPMEAEIDRMEKAEADGKVPKGTFSSMDFLMEMRGALNGYVAWPKRRAPLLTRDTDGILHYIPVHGGVTYAMKDGVAMVYGFDTAHYNSEHVPRTERPWIAWQCRVLYESVVMAAHVERDYLRAQSEEARGKALQPLIDLVPEQELSTGAMLSILSGRL